LSLLAVNQRKRLEVPFHAQIPLQKAKLH
jgi:hypothetical protein